MTKQELDQMESDYLDLFIDWSMGVSRYAPVKEAAALKQATADYYQQIISNKHATLADKIKSRFGRFRLDRW